MPISGLYRIDPKIAGNSYAFAFSGKSIYFAVPDLFDKTGEIEQNYCGTAFAYNKFMIQNVIPDRLNLGRNDGKQKLFTA